MSKNSPTRKLESRKCRHYWRRREQWHSRTSGSYVMACRNCRKRWAAERAAHIKHVLQRPKPHPPIAEPGGRPDWINGTDDKPSRSGS